MGKAVTRPITIRTTAVPVSPEVPDGVKFEMDDGGTITDQPIFDKIKDQMDEDDYHKVVFTLVNGTGVDLIFPTNKLRAMWVAKGTATQAPPCPRTTAHHKDIKAQNVQPLQLTVHNKNKDKALYKFALNFVRSDDVNQTKLISYDPIYDNRNGSVKSSANLLLTIGGVVVVGLAVLFGLKERADRIRKEREDGIRKERS